MMREVKIVLLPLLISNVLCLAQTKPSSFLDNLYDNFPIDSSIRFIANYCKSNNCSTTPDLYDTTKTDYSCDLHNWSVFDYKPTSINIAFFDGGLYPLDYNTSKETLISSLTVRYKDTVSQNAIKQYEILLEKFEKIYKHHKKLFLVSPHGKEGEVVKFYVHSLSKLPVLSIELVYETESVFGKGSSLEIAYIRPHPFSEDK
jgi:hypothetical protein